jgi:hypothetical protein
MAARITKYLNKFVCRGRSTGNSYQAEALTNVLRYHICRSSHSENRELPITKVKWDAWTLTDIPCNTAYWLWRKSEVISHGRVGQNCRLYNNYGSIFVHLYVKLSWRLEVDENWAIMVVQPAILTYPTMVFLLVTWSTGPIEWSTGNSYGIDKRFEVSYM